MFRFESTETSGSVGIAVVSLEVHEHRVSQTAIAPFRCQGICSSQEPVAEHVTVLLAGS